MHFGQNIRSLTSILFLNAEMLFEVHIHSRPAVPWKIQQRATKLIPTLQHLPYTDRLVSMKLPSLQYRRWRGDMILMYKIIHGFTGIDWQIYIHFEKYISQQATTRGHQYKVFKCPVATLQCLSYFFLYNSPHVE